MGGTDLPHPAGCRETIDDRGSRVIPFALAVVATLALLPLPTVRAEAPTDAVDLSAWHRVQALTVLGVAPHGRLLVLDVHGDTATVREVSPTTTTTTPHDLTGGRVVLEALDAAALPRTALWSARHGRWWVELDDGAVRWLVVDDEDGGHLVPLAVGPEAVEAGPRPIDPVLSADAEAVIWFEAGDPTTCLLSARLDDRGRLGVPTTVLCDGDPALGERTLDRRQRPGFGADPEHLLVPVRVPGTVHRTELAHLSLASSELTSLTPGDALQVTARGVRWLGAGELLAVTDEHGADTLEVITLDEAGDLLARHPLTDAALDVQVVAPPLGNDDGGPPSVFVAHRLGLRTRVQALEPRTGRVLAEATIAGDATLVGAREDGRVWVLQRSMRHPLRVLELERDEDRAALEISVVGELPQATLEALVHCRVEQLDVEIPALGSRPARSMEALLLTPAAGDPAELAVVRAFYGGLDRYSVADDQLCRAGIAVLSPAVRGTHGRGNAHAALDDADLGGAEIVELDLAAHAAAERLSLAPERVGLIGASRGGYAVLRALTRAPGDHDAHRFAFGFGVAVAPFTDLAAYAEESPRWTRVEAGEDVEVQRARSPVVAAEHLSAPVVLMHGVDDEVVSIAHSRRFVEAVDDVDRAVLIELAGGHGLSAVDLARWLTALRGAALRP